MTKKTRSFIATASIVIMITIFLMVMMQIIISKTKGELLEEKFRTTTEMMDIRCNEVESTGEDWTHRYDDYIKHICFYMQEIDRIPFTFGAVYDNELNLLSERTFHVAASDDPLDVYFDEDMFSLFNSEKFGVRDIEYPVSIKNNETNMRSMRIYFRRIPQIEDNYLIACIAQPFDTSLIELPGHYMRLIYIVIAIIGVSVCLFIMMFFRHFFSKQLFNSDIF